MSMFQQRHYEHLADTLCVALSKASDEDGAATYLQAGVLLVLDVTCERLLHDNPKFKVQLFRERALKGSGWARTLSKMVK